MAYRLIGEQLLFNPVLTYQPNRNFLIHLSVKLRKISWYFKIWITRTLNNKGPHVYTNINWFTIVIYANTLFRDYTGCAIHFSELQWCLSWHFFLNLFLRINGQRNHRIILSHDVIGILLCCCITFCTSSTSPLLRISYEYVLISKKRTNTISRMRMCIIGFET